MVHSAAGFALAAALLFGASAPLAKLFLRDSGAMMLAGLLYAGSGTGLALICAWKVKSVAESFKNLPRAEWLPLAGSSFSGGILGPTLPFDGTA